MLANYGYADGSGTYYISIDTDRCDCCGNCVEACPQRLFALEPDDYDEIKPVVKEGMLMHIKRLCAACKPLANPQLLPCKQACLCHAIDHSW